MSTQLEQILAYLDRDGVSEIVIAVGRPIAMRQKGAYVNLTARPLTTAMLWAFVEGSEIAPLIPHGDGSTDPTDLDVGKRRLRVRTGRRGNEIVVRVEKGAARTRVATKQPPQRVGQSSGEFELPVELDVPELPSDAMTLDEPGLPRRGSGAEVQRGVGDEPGLPRRGSGAEVQRGVGDEPGLPRRGSGAEVQRGVGDEPGLPRRGSAAEVQRGVGDEPGLPRRGSAAEVQRGVGDEPGLPRRGSAAEVQRGVGDEPGLPRRGSAAEVQRGVGDEPGLPRRGSAAEVQRGVGDEPGMPRRGSAAEVQRGVGDPKPAATFGKKPPVAPPEQYGGLELELEDASIEVVATNRPVAASQPAPVAPPPATSQPIAKPGTFAAYVAAARAAKASDLHIAGNRIVVMRTNNDLVPVDPNAAALSAADAEGLLLPLLSESERERLQTAGYVDLAVDAPGGGRLRANISRHQVGLKGTFRLAFDRPRTIEELGLPKDLAKVVSHHQGFVVIAGPSGHGKTTTLAALVDLVNSTRPHHILTVEDPIEIEHPRKMALVSQREAGRHTKSFAAALKASLREDPDVIVIGELRDRETVEIALTAAETGHLVIATMSTPSAAKTLDRLIDMFPPEEHSQVRASIAGALRAIVAQRLVPAIGGGVVPAIELVTGVLPLAVLIRDDKLFQLPNLMQRGRSFGMIRFDESLAELVKAGKITEDVAMQFAETKATLAQSIKGPAAAAAPAAAKGRFGGLFGKKDE